MRNKISHILFILIFIISCEGNPQENLCVNKKILDSVEDYIKENEYKIALYSEDGNLLHEVYFYLYFFNIDTFSYFTIWESFIFDDSASVFIDKEFLKNKVFHKFTILDRYVCVINNDENHLFSNYKEKTIQNNKKQNVNDIPIYDGILYPATYQYYHIGDEFFIEKADTLLFFFSSD